MDGQISPVVVVVVIFLLVQTLTVAHDGNKVGRLGKQQLYNNSHKLMISPSESPLNHQNQNENQESQNMRMEKGKHDRRHSSVDKSVAGGGVILGGLAATLLVAIGCYIRATRRKKVEPTSPSSPSSPICSKV